VTTPVAGYLPSAGKECPENHIFLKRMPDLGFNGWPVVTADTIPSERQDCNVAACAACAGRFFNTSALSSKTFDFVRVRPTEDFSAASSCSKPKRYRRAAASAARYDCDKRLQHVLSPNQRTRL